MARALILLPTLIFAAYCTAELSRTWIPDAFIYRLGPMQGASEQHRAGNWMPDLFIYRAGASLGWRGESAYSRRIADLVKEQYPGDDRLAANCGYFLPPQAIVLLGPFAAVPWATAKLLYVILCLASVVLCWYGLTFAFRNVDAPPLEKVPLLLPWLILLHPVLRMTFDVGQTAILVAGAVIAGQILYERKWPILGAFFWACAFVKPHIALALIPLAIYLSGWKRGALIVAWLVLLNLTGCLIAAVSPLDYLRYLGDSHKLVEFNRVEMNPQITSWNRLVVSLGGPAIELTLTKTLLGYAAFAVLIVVRCTLARRWPTPAWAVAIAMTAAMVCCQVMAYEAWLLVLAVPYLLECLERKRWIDLALVTALLMAQMWSLDSVVAVGCWLDAQFGRDSQLDWMTAGGPLFEPLFFSYRPWLIALLAFWLLARPSFVAPASRRHS
jgi:uncharacterized membrane protein YczE